MTKINLILLSCFLLVGCATRQDGWHYRYFNQNTCYQYYKGDYFISCSYNHYILFKSAPEGNVKVKEFKTLQEAKKTVDNLE